MLNHWMNAGCEINRIKTENTCEWWFIHQLLMTWRPMECFHIQIYLAFFNWNMFSTNTKTTEGIFLTYNSVKPVRCQQRTEKFFYFEKSFYILMADSSVRPCVASFNLFYWLPEGWRFRYRFLHCFWFRCWCVPGSSQLHLRKTKVMFTIVAAGVWNASIKTCGPKKASESRGKLPMKKMVQAAMPIRLNSCSCKCSTFKISRLQQFGTTTERHVCCICVSTWDNTLMLLKCEVWTIRESQHRRALYPPHPHYRGFDTFFLQLQTNDNLQKSLLFSGFQVISFYLRQSLNCFLLYHVIGFFLFNECLLIVDDGCV